MFVLHTVRSTLVTYASNHTTRDARSAGIVDDRVVAYGAGKVVQRQVEPRAVVNERVNLRIRLRPCQIGVQGGQHNLRDR